MLGLTKLAPGPGNVGLSERTDPSAEPGHVILNVTATGICGTDLHIYDGEFPSRPPVTMGHEISGVVAELGDGVDEAWRGARVVTETYFSTCENCAQCLSGRINLCLERRSIGSYVDGGFASRVHVPARNLHHIPDWLDGRAAAMTEPLACCCQSLLNPTRIEAGDAVLVVGPGPIGLLAAQLVRREATSMSAGHRAMLLVSRSRPVSGSRRRRRRTAPPAASTSSSSAPDTRPESRSPSSRLGAARAMCRSASRASRLQFHSTWSASAS